QDAAAVHHLGEIDGRPALAEHIADRGTQQEATQFVQHRPDHLGPLALGESLVLLPERPQTNGIVELLDQARSHAAVEEQDRYVAERGAWMPEQGQHRRAKDVVGPWPPEALVSLAEDADH